MTPFVERRAEALAPRLRGDAERADPAGGAEARAAHAAQQPPVVVGHQNVAVRARAGIGDQPPDAGAEARTRQQVG